MAARNAGGKRVGPIASRSQTFNSKIERWVVRDTSTGQFLRVKADDQPYKNIRREPTQKRPK